MANVYIEPRPKGRPEGSSIDDYVIEDHADRVTCHVQNAARSNRLGKKRTAIRRMSLAQTLE